MEQVILMPFADNKLMDLVDILYEDEYFGFRADAKKYVDNIYEFIYSIPTQRRKKTKHNKYGAWYCQYKSNRQTTYYICFDMEDDVYLIKNITNNHSKDYPDFIKGII